MEKRMFAIFILSGLCHFSFSFYAPQYHFISDTKDWISAQQYCRTQYTDLATVTDEHDLETFTGLASVPGLSVQTYVHIGLYKDWGWSRSAHDDYKEGEPAYWNWASREPNVGLCGSMSETGQWYATDCNINLSVVCYDALATDISQRFILTPNPMNWLTAQTFCRTAYTDLARVRNQQENDLLQPMVVGGQQMWLGLAKTSWRWSDGSEPSFIPWELSVLQSGGVLDCGAIVNSSNTLGLVQRHYTDLQPFICYSVPRKKLSVTLNLATLSSSVDMTDMAVRKSILTLVKKMVGGSSNDLNVSWQKTPRKLNPLIQEKCPP